jgi:predicted lipid-binding transport protein (Tim44 family)
MRISILAVIGLIGMAGSLHAQEATGTSSSQPAAAPASATKAPASATDASAQSATPSSGVTPATSTAAANVAAPASAAPAGPSADFLKQARAAGYQPKVRSGTYSFCKSDSATGSRFVTEKCYNEATLANILERAQQQRDQLNQGSGCAGGFCGSK